MKKLARQHGMIASFMAKPYGQDSGNGFHVHFSLLDQLGHNVFDDGSAQGSAVLRQAVAGLLAAMPESMLVLAPHFNSYRRFQPGSHAPTTVSWGYENRTASIRIPGGASVARRIEHRVAGADANPYLVLACVLGSAFMGIEQQLPAPDPIRGNAYDAEVPQLPNQWHSALTAFEQGSLIRTVLNAQVCDVLLSCKRQEIAVFAQQVSDFEYHSYLEHV